MADLSITAANVAIIEGAVRTVTAGATITAGKLLYMAAGLALVASDDTAAHAETIGIALNGASSGQPVSYAGSGALVNPGATVAIGKHYVVSTSGGIAPVDDIAGGEFANYFGEGITTSTIRIGILNGGVAAAGAVA